MSLKAEKRNKKDCRLFIEVLIIFKGFLSFRPDAEKEE